jgi:lipopolysaccharide heptosyltransferase I
MKVLIVKLSSLGDVVHALPVLNVLKKGFSSGPVEIDWLVEEAASGIIMDHPMIDEVIVVKKGGWVNSLSDNYATAKRLAKKNYDIVLDLQGLLKSGIWVWLTKGERRIGFSNAREMSHVFLNEKLPAFDPEMHAVDRYMMLARYAVEGAHDEAVEFPLVVSEATLGKVQEMLKESGVGDGFVTLLCGSRWETKHWTVEGFAALAKSIKEKLSLDVVLAGSEAELPLTDKIREASGAAAVNMSGRTTLMELAGLLSLSRFAVTIDSGPMHIAAAVGTPVVALFGATSPRRTGPYGEGHIVIEKGLPCSPCFMRKCPEPRCMEEITAAEVMEAIRDSSLVASTTSEGKTLRAESS